MGKNDGASIWHARLGNLSVDKLKVMVLKNLVNGLPKLNTFGNGEVCVKGVNMAKHIVFHLISPILNARSHWNLFIVI